MANDSRDPGILAPVPDFVVALDVVRNVLAEISGLDPSMIRRRWQPNPPPMPKAFTDWIALSVDALQSEGIPEIDHFDRDISDPEAANSTARIKQTISFRASCFGPGALNIAESLRAGLSMPFNNVALQEVGLTMLFVDPQLVRSPDLVNGRWIDKWDISFKVGRMACRTFNVRSIASAETTIINDKANKLNG